MRQFGFFVPGGGRADPLPGLLEPLGTEKMKKKVPTESVEYTIDARQAGKMEILDIFFLRLSTERDGIPTEAGQRLVRCLPSPSGNPGG